MEILKFLGLSWMLDYWWIVPVVIILVRVLACYFPMEGLIYLLWRKHFFRESMAAKEKMDRVFAYLSQDFHTRASFRDRGCLLPEQFEAMMIVSGCGSLCHRDETFFRRYNWKVFLHLERCERG